MRRERAAASATARTPNGLDCEGGARSNQPARYPPTMLKSRATSDGTVAYASRFPQLPGNYRPLQGWSASSLGIGTYLGETDAPTDRNYAEAIGAALRGGINLIDTAVNYRLQRSERVIRAVLGELVSTGKIAREEVIVATKGGYITFDDEMPPDPRGWFQRSYLATGIIGPGDLVQGSHCMTPRYLDAMIETSRRNLGLETIDIYYLHNPESQLAEVSRASFNERIAAAFAFLEQAVTEKRIAVYGVATWNGFRAPRNDPGYLGLAELAGLAREAGGENHHFRVIQLPYNLAMTEALTAQNQPQPDGRMGNLLACADALGISVCASASLLQGQLSRGLPEILKNTFTGFETDAQRALQFVRSTPGINVALTGMSSVEHVESNLRVAERSPGSFEELMKLFQPAART